MAFELKKTFPALLKDKNPDEYVFRPYVSENRLYQRFAELLKQLEMKGTLYALRHAFASHLALEGFPFPVIKKLLGHSSISTTKMYAHLSPEVHRAAVDKLPF